MTTGTKFNIEKFNEKNDFGLWQHYHGKQHYYGERLNASHHNGKITLVTLVEEQMSPWKRSFLSRDMLLSWVIEEDVGDETGGRDLEELVTELESLDSEYVSYKSKRRMRIILVVLRLKWRKRKRCGQFYDQELKRDACKSQSEHIDEFHKLLGDLAAINTVISDEDQTLLLLTSLPSSYDNFVDTLLYGQDILKLEDVLTTLNSRELQKMTEAKGDGGKGLYVRGIFGQRDMEHGTYSAWSKSWESSNRLRCCICQSKEYLKRDCPRYNHKKSQGFVKNEDQVFGSGADGYDSADVMIAMSIEELLDWIIDSGGSYHITYRRNYLVDFEEYDGGNILLGDGREYHIQGIGKVQVHKRDGSSFVLDNVRYVSELRRNLISLGTLEKEGFTVKMQSAKIKVIKGSLIGLSGTRRSNCVYTLDGQAVTSKTLKRRNQLGEYQTGWKIKTGNVIDSCNQSLGCPRFLNIGYNHVYISSEWSPSSAIGFKTPVDMLGFFCWLASIKQGMLEPVKVKCIFLGYRKGIVGNKLRRLDNVTSKVLQGVEFEMKPQEGHTFKVEPHWNVDHVFGSQEVQTQDFIHYHSARDREQHSVIFKWKAGLKDGMDARSDVYVLSNATKGLLDKAKGNILGMEIVRDQSGNTLRVSQSRFYNGKLVQTLLEGHSILSLEGSLSRDCDVEKNDVGMLDKFDRGLQTDIYVFMDFDYTMGRSITVMSRSITKYGLMIQGCSGS
ncbi:hypothetical protein Tco_1294603 [Tanacetum coccineum]